MLSKSIRLRLPEKDWQKLEAQKDIDGRSAFLGSILKSNNTKPKKQLSLTKDKEFQPVFNRLRGKNPQAQDLAAIVNGLAKKHAVA